MGDRESDHLEWEMGVKLPKYNLLKVPKFSVEVSSL
jgi:hypothetical protein